MTISIAMATFNGERFLKEQLDSIITQSVPPTEIVVCDDCSIDSTIQILEEYQRKSLIPISIVQNEANLGYCRNFQKAISLCTGEFIALADQDDIWEINKLQRLLEEIKEFDAVCTDALLVDSDNKSLGMKLSEKIDVVPPKNIFDAVHTYFVTGGTLLVRKLFVHSLLPFPDSVVYHDYWIGVNAFFSNGIVYLNEPLERYRQHSVNQVGSGSRNIIKRLLDILQGKTRFSSEYKKIIKTIRTVRFPHLTSLSELDSDLYPKEIKNHIEDTRKMYQELLAQWFNPLVYIQWVKLFRRLSLRLFIKELKFIFAYCGLSFIEQLRGLHE